MEVGVSRHSHQCSCLGEMDGNHPFARGKWGGLLTCPSWLSRRAVWGSRTELLACLPTSTHPLAPPTWVGGCIASLLLHSDEEEVGGEARSLPLFLWQNRQPTLITLACCRRVRETRVGCLAACWVRGDLSSIQTAKYLSAAAAPEFATQWDSTACCASNARAARGIISS